VKLRRLGIVALVVSGTLLGYVAGARRSTSPMLTSEPSPGSFAAVRALIDDATVRGRWTAQDQAHAHNQLLSLSPTERRQLMTIFARAVNDGRVKLETEGPPLL
jgi:hypothetical protein